MKGRVYTAKGEACISVRAYRYEPMRLTDLHDSAQIVGRCTEHQA